MSPSITTTLPISYRQGRGVKMFITPWYAKCVSVLTASELRLPLNFQGRRYVPDTEVAKVKQEFSQRLQTSSCHINANSIFTDKDPDFLKYVQTKVAASIDQRLILVDQRLIRTCSCGTIDLLEVAAIEVLESRRGKYLQMRNGTPFCCNECNQPTTIVRDTCLLLRGQNALSPAIEVYPESLARRVTTEFNRHGHEDLLVSKLPHARDDESSPRVAGRLLDPDLLLGLYLPYLEGVLGVTEFNVVAGFSTLSQVVRALTISHRIGLQSKVRLVIHPKIEFDEGGSGAWEELVSRGRDPIRTMQSLVFSMHPDRHSCKFTEDSYRLCELTFPHFDQTPATRSTRSVAEVSKLLSHENLAQEFKKIRRRVHGFDEKPAWDVLNCLM